MKYDKIYVNAQIMEEFIDKINNKYKDYSLVNFNRVIINGITIAIEGILQKEIKD